MAKELVPMIPPDRVGALQPSHSRQQIRLRCFQNTEEAVRQGGVERPWDRLIAGLVLGGESFARKLRPGIRVKKREQRQARKLAPAVSWAKIVSVLEQVRGEKWEQFSARHGDWGRDTALWLGRRQGRLRLAALGELAGGMDHAAVSVAVRRFGERVQQDPSVRQTLETIKDNC